MASGGLALLCGLALPQSATAKDLIHLLQTTKKLSATQRIAEYRKLSNVSPTVKGLTDHAELTPSRPYVENKAALELACVRAFRPAADGGTAQLHGAMTVPDATAVRPRVVVEIQVARAGKPHLVTFYFHKEGVTPLEAEFFVEAPGQPRSTFTTNNTPRAVSAVLTPSRVGRHAVVLGTDTAAMMFQRVEVAVVEH